MHEDAMRAMLTTEYTERTESMLETSLRTLRPCASPLLGHPLRGLARRARGMRVKILPVLHVLHG